MPQSDILKASFSEVSHAILSNKITCASLIEEYLKQSVKKNPTYNAFIEVFKQEARERAHIIDKKIKSGKQKKLAGLIIGIKDNICIKGKEITAASRILKGYISPYHATVVERLINEDAIIIGRLNCDEFGMGSSNENSIYGPVKNPFNIECTPGGSSGGPAAAVAGNLCMAALGTDTGGSIRQPASFCGLVGLKPSYGSVSRYGCIAYASSMDQIGILSKNIDDCKEIFNVISGKDKNDSTTVAKQTENSSISFSDKNWNIAYINYALENDFINNEIKYQISQLINKLQQQNIVVEPIELQLDHLPPTYYTLTSAEAATNLQRYDGIHFGYSAKSDNLKEIYTKSRNQGFGKEPKKRILLGNYLLSNQNNNNLLEKAQKLRIALIDQMNHFFKTYDFILTPTTFETAFKLDSKDNSPEGQYFQDVFLVLANLAGLPAISLPLFMHNKNNMPFGLHIMAQKYKEKELFAFAREIMQVI